MYWKAIGQSIRLQQQLPLYRLLRRGCTVVVVVHRANSDVKGAFIREKRGPAHLSLSLNQLFFLHLTLSVCVCVSFFFFFFIYWVPFSCTHCAMMLWFNGPWDNARCIDFQKKREGPTLWSFLPGKRIRPADRETWTSLIASFGDDMVAPSALDNQTTQTEMIPSDYFLLTHLKKRKSIQNWRKKKFTLAHTWQRVSFFSQKK